MSSIRNLTIWVAAAQSETDEDSNAADEAKAALEAHYFSGTVKLNASQIETINIKMVQLIGDTNNMLVAQGIFATVEAINSHDFGIMQLTQGNILNNANLIMGSTFIAYDSMRDIGMPFQLPPEISLSWEIDNLAPYTPSSGCASVDLAFGQSVFNYDLENEIGTPTFGTLMSPINYYNFYTTVNSTGAGSAYNCIFSWATAQSAFVNAQAVGNLITRTISKSLPTLEPLALNLATRSSAYYNSIGNYSCDFFFNQTYPDNFAKVTEICDQYDFATIDGVQLFINGTWYRDEYKDQIMTVTGMDEAQYTAFYDFETYNTFGYWLKLDLSDIF